MWVIVSFEFAKGMESLIFFHSQKVRPPPKICCVYKSQFLEAITCFW